MEEDRNVELSGPNNLALETRLAAHTCQSDLCGTLPGGKIQCQACGHRCKIADGRSGVCRVRSNRGGILKVPFGYVSALHCDPIEKKPFYHTLPGANAMSFGMLGCNYHCSFCQNWQISQTIRDPKASGEIREISAVEIVDLARRCGAEIVTATYNEPLITSEWSVEVFRQAKKYGLYTSYVSNGNGTPEAIDYLRPWTDFFKIDLKCFDKKSYRHIGGSLDSVLDTIQRVNQSGLWMEIVTLAVPGLNDSEGELRDIARFIASVDRNIPWHISAFHENYKLHGVGNTRLETLLRAGETGREEGLAFVYIGNVAGYAPEWENTNCPDCGALLVQRTGYHTEIVQLENGRCRACGSVIPGVWNRRRDSAA